MSNNATPNKEMIRQWVTALRSGRYTQGIGRLAVDGDDGVTRYCCLGVACDLFGQQVGITETVREDSSSGNDIGTNAVPGKVHNFTWPVPGDGPYDTRTLLPGPIGILMGVHRFTRPDGDYDVTVRLPNGEHNELSSLNDAGATFAEIADHIERTFLSED